MFRGDEAPAFSPADLADLALWLDATDASTITLDGSNNVSQWDDKSGNARHATQAAALNRPTYLSSGINGLPTVRGDGDDDIMSWTAFSSGTIHNFYIVAAFDTVLNEYTSFGGFFGSINGEGGIAHDVFFNDSAANPRVDSRQLGGGDNAYIAAGNVANIKSGAAAVHSFYRNGGSYGAKWTYETKATWTLTGTYATSATKSTRIFSNYFASVSFQISELLCYTRDLSASEESELSAYFTAKYGVGI